MHIKNKYYIPHQKGFYEKYIKRPLDFILSLCAILVLSPVLLLVAILVKIKLGSPVIFKQERPGLYGKIFNMYKFRTMTDEKDENGNLVQHGHEHTEGHTHEHTHADGVTPYWCWKDAA